MGGGGGGLRNFRRGYYFSGGGGLNIVGRGDNFSGGVVKFLGAGLRFFRVGLGIIREAGLTFFFGRGCDFLRVVEIFSGGVEIISGRG